MWVFTSNVTTAVIFRWHFPLSHPQTNTLMQTGIPPQLPACKRNLCQLWWCPQVCHFLQSTLKLHPVWKQSLLWTIKASTLAGPVPLFSFNQLLSGRRQFITRLCTRCCYGRMSRETNSDRLLHVSQSCQHYDICDISYSIQPTFFSGMYLRENKKKL